MKRRNTGRALADMKTREAEHRATLNEQWLATVPGAYKNHTIDEIDSGWSGRITKRQRPVLHRYLIDPTQFLLLQGESGVGKSTLATTLITELVQRLGVDAEYRSAARLLNDFSFDKGVALERTSSVPILLLDDLGAANESISAHQTKSLWAMLDARWSAPSTLTIITTNMAVQSNDDGQGLADWLGPSAWDRVSDRMTRINIEGDTFRGQDD